MSTIYAGFNHTLHVRSDWAPNFWIDNQPTYNIKTETNVDSEPRRHIIKPRRRQLAVSRVNSCIMDSMFHTLIMNEIFCCQSIYQEKKSPKSPFLSILRRLVVDAFGRSFLSSTKSSSYLVFLHSSRRTNCKKVEMLF